MKIYCLQNIIRVFLLLHFMDKNPFLTHIQRDLKQKKHHKLYWLCVLSDYHCALWKKCSFRQADAP